MTQTLPYCMPDATSALTDEIIKQQIERGSRVIDLGCGDGHLLATLRDEHDCSVMGIELDRDRFARGTNRLS